MLLKEVPLVGLHWQAACSIVSQNLRGQQERFRINRRPSSGREEEHSVTNQL